MDLNPQITARMEAIEWFSHCGEPFDLPLDMDVLRISSWKQAIKCYHAPKWEDTTLEARNMLTGYLHKHHNARYQQWNKITEAGREFLEAEIEPKLVAFQEQHNLDKAFLDTVRWDLLGAIMEDAYRDCDLPTLFFHDLLKVYEAGHFPCGWEGGPWPLGRLIVL